MDENKMNINWFPGHMAKAIRQIKERINLVDMIIEICDARAPKASVNPIVQELISNKFYLKLLTKMDLADPNYLKEYEDYYKANNINYLFVNLNNNNCLKPIIQMIEQVSKPLALKDIKRGLKPRNVRIMVLGIPNVGKSTFINLLAKKKSAPVGNIPGFTKAIKMVHCDGFDLLDTPGILWPNLSENHSGEKLALIGCIKEDILPIVDLIDYGLNYLNNNYSDLLISKYGIKYQNTDQYLQDFAKAKGHLLKDGKYDIERSASFLLNDIKNGRIGKIIIERLED